MLNAKQQRFVYEYLKDLNATQAAIRTGYSNRTACEQGSRLLANVNIRKSIKLAQEKAAKSAEISVDDILDNLKRLAELAEKKGNFAAAIRANELIGKQIGMFVERIKVEDDSVIEIRWINQKENADNSSTSDAPGSVGDIPRSDAV